MNSVFRLYGDSNTGFNSTIFDLISGNRETKQTQGLAYVFSFYPKLLIRILNLPAIKNEILRCTEIKSFPRKYSRIEINAELLSASNKRADIVIRLDRGNKPFAAIIFEAKSITIATNIHNLTKQLDSYLEEEEFPGLAIYPHKIGITLTKQKYISQKYPSITWDDIINTLFDFSTAKRKFCQDYLNFLTGIEKSMNYYEEEVISIPAGGTMDLVVKHKVYVCPDTSHFAKTGK